MKATTTATTLTVSWNCKNFEMLSYTFLPHITAFTIEVKLSSVSMMSDASFATSVPAMPCKNIELIASRGMHPTATGRVYLAEEYLEYDIETIYSHHQT